MIKLSDISTAGIISNRTGVNNYEQLKQLILSNYEYYKKFENDVMLIEKHMEKLNKLGYNPKVFSSDYIFSFYDKQIVLNTDKSTGGEELLIDNPLDIYSMRRSVLRQYSIYDIKLLLNRCIIGPEIDEVENALLYYIKFINDEDINKILKAIKFYNMQIENQYNSLQIKKSDNLFYENYTEKKALIICNLKYILDYIIDNNCEFLWWKISQYQIDELTASLNSNISLRQRELKNIFINMLSNYTSLSDFENNKIKDKTLIKFKV